LLHCGIIFVANFITISFNIFQLTFEQIQDIVSGTIAAALDTGDLIGGAPQRQEFQMPPPEMPPPDQMMPPPEMMEPQQ